jgi:hypothetical protein
MNGSPFGVAWFFLYGYYGVPAAVYLPRLRELGARFTKVYLFWQQIEPERGRFDWTAADAFVEQLDSPEEGLISLFSTSQCAVKQPSALLPPSPAKSLDDYYHCVHGLVKRYRGRVRYWQNDAEPNNRVFWSGSKEEFVEQLRVFYRAVKDADPDAQVVVGGYDGMFIPPDMAPLPGQRTAPFPQQEAGLAFFDYVLQQAAGAFDIFDLRLYGDPYSIVARIEYMRGKMRALGFEKPFLCTEYGGPNLFEFAANRQYLPLVEAWSQHATGTAGSDGAKQVDQLYRNPEVLEPETQMFMQGCSPDLEAKYHRIQSRSLVMRNLFALSAGVQRTLYWDLVAAHNRRDNLMDLMYGKIGLIELKDGALGELTPTGEAFGRMAHMLAGVREVTRVAIRERPAVFLFRVDRGERGPVYVVWERRDAFQGEDAPAVPVAWPWQAGAARAVDALGAVVPAAIAEGDVRLDVSLTPIYVEEVQP